MTTHASGAAFGGGVGSGGFHVPDVTPTYQHDPLPTTEHTRMVILHPGSSSDELSCHLVNARVASDVEDYVALSYVWGNAKHLAYLLCDGLPLSITANLAEALRALRDPIYPRRIWADAVCINQTDHVEKSHQVKRIGVVFSCAQRVVVWLGHDRENIASDCFTVIKDTNRYLGEKLEECGNTIDVPTLVRPYPIIHDRSRWDKVRELLGLPWFRRVWVIPEAGLAKECILRWGQHEIEFAHVVELGLWHALREDLAEITGPLDVLRLTDLFRDVYMSYDNKETWRSSLPLLRTEVGLGKSNRQVFLDILLAASGMMATDKRDHVFAFLGSSLSFQPDGKLLLEPDYSMDLREVFFETACSILKHPREAPFLLSRVKHAFEGSLNDADFPSWLPRWDRVIDYTISRSKFWYRAGGSEDFVPEVHPDKSLSSRGIIFDRVVYTSRNIMRHNVSKSPAEWDMEYRMTRKPFIDVLWEETLRAAKPADVNRFERDFASTIVRSYPATPGKICDAQQMAEFAAYRQLVRQAIGCDKCDVDDVESGPGGARFPRNFLHRLNYCANLVVVVLESGRLGLAPHVARPTDVCCILPGVPVPMVLRPHKDGLHKLVGESYIHGVMGGEIMEDLTKGNVHEETVTIS